MVKRDDQWWLFINGFYEGSVIHGNRFRDTNYSALYKAARVKKEDLKDADPFVKKNLGLILHGNPDYYHNLFRLSSDDAYKVFKFRSYPYFLVNSDGTVVSQFSLSTGESLLVSILHSINYKIGQRKKLESTYLVLLDEIELALHPSALVRLLNFLREFSKERNVAVYFSTHSVELLRFIQAENIYYLEKHADTSVEVVNPCYPAYATRSIYSHDGYDLLIITEDELSMKIVDWLLRRNNLLSVRLIHIIPAGGWENVISLHQDLVSNNVLGVGKRAISVLDGDVQQEFERKYTSRGLHRNLNVVFLPIKSAEKFLKQKLLDDVDHKFFRKFGDSFFRQKSLQQVIEDYLKQRKGEDSKGKALLRVLKSELKIPDAEFYTLLTNYCR
ncbi:hypothetical protein AF2641_11535 [Anoxybacillus flavithermus]|nr:hypothetical protein AF2641_11535 [Anoxybacillus flavithermus]